MTARTLAPIEPRCTGICGALATRPPSHRRARRSSRALLDIDGLGGGLEDSPICSAMCMNRLLRFRCGPGWAPPRRDWAAPTLRRPWSAAPVLVLRRPWSTARALACCFRAGSGVALRAARHLRLRVERIQHQLAARKAPRLPATLQNQRRVRLDDQRRADDRTIQRAAAHQGGINPASKPGARRCRQLAFLARLGIRSDIASIEPFGPQRARLQ